MDYKIFELEFKTGIHLGNGMLSNSDYIIKADTLFSALCIEAQKIGRLEELVDYVKNNQMLLSDSMPYVKIGGESTAYLIPKPMIAVESEHSGNSIMKKKIKKLKYLPIENLSDYLTGNIAQIEEDTQKIGYFESITKANISRIQEDTKPYHVGVYQFYKDRGLYFILGYHCPEVYDLLKELFEMLSFSGIGGERSSGLGKFSLKEGELPGSIKKRLRDKREYNVKMSLSVCLPKEDELEKSLEQSSYLLEKRSGFIYSDCYAPELSRKIDLYVFSAGSCFKNNFLGDIYDVSSEYGKHPVYRYAKAMLLGVKK